MTDFDREDVEDLLDSWKAYHSTVESTDPYDLKKLLADFIDDIGVIDVVWLLDTLAEFHA